MPGKNSKQADEIAVKKNAADALQQIADMLERMGHPPNVQIPDKIVLHHPIPPLTQKIDKELQAVDPSTSQPSTTDEPPKKPSGKLK